jgi:hypothetical protein
VSYELHLKNLEQQHHALDKRIDGMVSTGVFDDAELSSLKRQRLHLKTKIVTLIQDHREPPYRTTR